MTLKKGKLTQGWRHARFGSGEWILDETTLKPINAAPSMMQGAGVASTLPASRSISSYSEGAADLIEKMKWGRGAGLDPNVRYALRWKTQGPNRDVKPPIITPDSRLEVLAFRYAEPIGVIPFRRSGLKNSLPATRLWERWSLTGRKRSGSDARFPWRP